MDRAPRASMKSVNRFACGLVSVALSGSWCGGGIRVIAAITAITVLTACEQKLTDTAYEALTPGMSLSQVERVLGGSGDEDSQGGYGIDASGLGSRSKGTPANEKTYIWKEKDRLIRVTFRDDKMIDKGRSGF